MVVVVVVLMLMLMLMPAPKTAKQKSKKRVAAAVVREDEIYDGQGGIHHTAAVYHHPYECHLLA